MKLLCFSSGKSDSPQCSDKKPVIDSKILDYCKQNLQLVFIYRSIIPEVQTTTSVIMWSEAKTQQSCWSFHYSAEMQQTCDDLVSVSWLAVYVDYFPENKNRCEKKIPFFYWNLRISETHLCVWVKLIGWLLMDPEQCSVEPEIQLESSHETLSVTLWGLDVLWGPNIDPVRANQLVSWTATELC